jgi:hypothetical protein
MPTIAWVFLLAAALGWASFGAHLATAPHGRHNAQHIDYLWRATMTASQDAINAAAATLNAAADRIEADLIPETPDDLTALDAAVARVDALVPAPAVDAPVTDAPIDGTVDPNTPAV